MVGQTVINTKVSVAPEFTNAFAGWQAQFHQAIANFPGFVSLEILCHEQGLWIIVQRFESPEAVAAWQRSQKHRDLIEELNALLGTGHVQESEVDACSGVTELFVTEVAPKNATAFSSWLAKIHHMEAKFPGFRGMHVQQPCGGKNWITLLQFDSIENLDRWFTSNERVEVLKEAQTFITSIESHRVISSYSGWFSSLTKKGLAPPVWKQTMLVLLVLFPIVMLELYFLSPLLAQLNPSLATFIGNALSVSLISWPFLPIAIRCLGWWLSPERSHRTKTLLGVIIVLALYAIEIVLFWFFPFVELKI